MRKRLRKSIITGQQTLHKILPTDAFTKEQKEIIDTLVRGIVTGDDAQRAAGLLGWSYHNRFLPGNVGILCYNGIEVAIFYKRQVIEVRSEACDPAPAYKIQDPREAWIRTEFLHTRASTVRQNWITEKETAYNDEITHLRAVNKQQQIELDILRRQVDTPQKKGKK